jgi:hypothetical protein
MVLPAVQSPIGRLSGSYGPLWVLSARTRAQKCYAKHRFAFDGTRQTYPDTGVEEQRWVRGCGIL